MNTVEDDRKKNKADSEQQEDAQSASSRDQAPSDSVVLSRKEHEETTARLRELEEIKDKLLRSAADFENAKKRLAREREEFVRFSQENLIKSLLPALDNFERALAHAEIPDSPSSSRQTGNIKGVIAGVEMVYKQLTDVLKSQGLVRLKTVGETFDPHQHEAVAYTEEPGRDQEIIEELEPGYMLNNRLLRAAKVRIRVAASSESSSGAKGAS